MLEEFFTADITGNVYYKRVLFEGFVCWYEWDFMNKKWYMMRGVNDSYFTYKRLEKIKKSDMFIELL